MENAFPTAVDLKAALDTLEAGLLAAPALGPTLAVPLEQQPFSSFFHS